MHSPHIRVTLLVVGVNGGVLVVHLDGIFPEKKDRGTNGNGLALLRPPCFQMTRRPCGTKDVERSGVVPRVENVWISSKEPF